MTTEQPVERFFNVTVETFHDLSVKEIWPDGDAPEDPTVEDVVEVMKQYSLRQLLRDWELETGIEIRVEGKLVAS